MLKKLIILIFVFLLINSTNLSSQVKPKEFNVGGGVGLSLIGNIFRQNISAGSTDMNISPVINGTFDYRISDEYSLGLAFSHQYLSFKIQDYTYIDDNGVLQQIFLNGSINRKNLSFRFLYHYNFTDNLDIYSGLRLGYTHWSFKANAPDIFNEVGMPEMLIAPQIILIGLRAYVTEVLSLNFEVNIGSPYYTSMGLNYKL